MGNAEMALGFGKNVSSLVEKSIYKLSLYISTEGNLNIQDTVEAKCG